MSTATISNHASSLLLPLKYYHRAHAPRFEDVNIIRHLRKMAMVLQKQGDLERTSMREDLRFQNKWLDWWVYISLESDFNRVKGRQSGLCQQSVRLPVLQ